MLLQEKLKQFLSVQQLLQLKLLKKQTLNANQERKKPSREKSIQIQGDFTEDSIKDEILKSSEGKVNIVMSDMAVNTTGIKNIDAIQTGELCMEAMIFSKDILQQDGNFISKIFMGGSFNEIVAKGKEIFKEVKIFKPKSSRKDSKESFIICKKLR